MSKSSETNILKSINKTPWHLWVIGTTALLWSAMAALNFTITQTKYAAYLRIYTPEQLVYFYGIPIWLVISWGVCVWGGVVGSVLLLMRKLSSVHWYCVSVLASAISSIYFTAVLNKKLRDISGFESLFLPSIIFLISIGLFSYAKKMEKAAVIS